MTFSRLATALFGFIFASSLAIGTAHAAPAETPEMVVAVYGVADLVIPLGTAQGSKTTEESLMTLVRHLVDPASWEDQGGEANVQFYPVGYGLVVRQTAENQEKVTKLLAELRRFRDQKVALELSLISVGPEGAQQIKTVTGMTGLQGTPATAIIGNCQLNQCLELVQLDPIFNLYQEPQCKPQRIVCSGQKCDASARLPFISSYSEENGSWSLADLKLSGDLVPVVSTAGLGRKTTITKVPKITVFNSQSATIYVDDELAFLDSLDLDPCIILDLNLSYTLPSQCRQTLTLDETPFLANGQTLVCHLGHQVGEVKCPFADIAKHFRGIWPRHPSQDVFLFVTTRLVSNGDCKKENAPTLSYPQLRQGSHLARAGLFEVEDQPTLAAEKPLIVGELFIVGNELTQSDHILSFVDLYPGQPLNYPALRQIEIKLTSSGLFDTQDRPTLTVLDRDDGGESEFKDILISVKEDKSISASMARLLWKTKETLSCIKDLANYCTNEIRGCFIDVENLDTAPAELEPEKVEAPKLTTRIYPVADLIIPIPNAKSLQIESAEARWRDEAAAQSTCGGYCSPMPCPCSQAPKPCGQQTLEAQLIKLISRAIDPHSWSHVGGSASIQYYPIGNALVVNQTEANQEKIAELLASLRKLQNVEVAVETRLVSLAPEFAEELFILIQGGKVQPIDGVTYLTDVQLSMFLEAAQGDRRTNVMQAPKITIFNGQTANINVGDEVEVIGVDFEQVNGESIPFHCRQARVPYGVFMTTTPVVSEDRQHIRSHFSFVTTAINGKNTDKQFVESLTLETVIDLGDGKTAMFHVGKTTGESRKVSKTPLLWRLPVVGEHFKQVSYETEEREMFLMITTRVIINEEEAPECRGELTDPALIAPCV